MLFGYARVSRGKGQSTAAQRRLLREAGAEKVYQETASGGRSDRPELSRLLGQLRPGDVVLVWKLDRLARSLKDLLHLLERIEAADAGFRSLTESIDTITPAGRMLMQMLGSFAEYERAMVRERTAAGLAAARAEGRVGGGRPKLTPAQRADIVENVRSGRRTAAQMARLYAVSPPTVSRILATFRVSRPDNAARMTVPLDGPRPPCSAGKNELPARQRRRARDAWMAAGTHPQVSCKTENLNQKKIAWRVTSLLDNFTKKCDSVNRSARGSHDPCSFRHPAQLLRLRAAPVLAQPHRQADDDADGRTSGHRARLDRC
jgi:DNA invertase Pin-like site-specific DNA recombinase